MPRVVEANGWYYTAGVPVGCCLRCRRIQTFDEHPLKALLGEHLHYYFWHYGPSFGERSFWERPRPEGP